MTLVHWIPAALSAPPPLGPVNAVTFLLFSAVVMACSVLALILGPRRWLAHSMLLVLLAALITLGIWRGDAGHPGWGTIGRTDTGYSLDGHGTDWISQGMMASAIALGLLFEGGLLLLFFKKRLPPRSGALVPREIVWVIALLAGVGAATRLLRFDDLARLHEAADAGRARAVAHLVASDPSLVDRQHFNYFVLWRAARRGDPEVVRILLEAGADPRRRSFVPTREGWEDPFLQAAAGGHLEAARLLLRAGVEPERDGEPKFGYLHWAADERKPEVIRLLLEEGADVNAEVRWGSDGDNETALYFARDPAVVRALLEHGADPHLGHPLHGAARANAASLRLLLAAGAELNTLDFKGRTALAYASMDAAKVLIEAGADLELGQPLHYLVQGNRPREVKVLVEAGANVNALDPEGHTPLFYAERREGILKYLREHGAR